MRRYFQAPQQQGQQPQGRRQHAHARGEGKEQQQQQAEAGARGEAEAQALALLSQEMGRLQEERRRVAQMRGQVWRGRGAAGEVSGGQGRQAAARAGGVCGVARREADRPPPPPTACEQLEEASARLERDRAAFERQQREEAARFEAERGEALRRLARDRRVLEQQSRAVLRLPTHRDKAEVQAVEVRRGGRAHAWGGGARCSLSRSLPHAARMLTLAGTRAHPTCACLQP